ncbi:efflux transporter outer membrane subunit [Pedobacter nutrimenti]|uniref:efflux transporter outer membrane subunit n=1 Tax=Pedobacter nutrimenti TaxID=1241337 RepID=UPI00292D91C0|nr:efflux transporter outer membrane subunit [Pedobacter nutrimenti]
MNKLIYSAVFLLLLSACQTVKEYSRPDLDVPTNFRGAKVQAQDENENNLISWKTFFSDNILQNMINIVLQRNYDLAQAMDNIRINQQYLKQSRAAWQPSISMNINAGSNYFSDNSLNGSNGFNLNNTIGVRHIDDYTIGSEISWEADIWGKLKNQKAEALAGWLQSQQAKRALQTRLIASTAIAYYNIIMLKEQLGITRKNLALSDSIVHLICLQQINGAATSLALQQAEVQRKSIEAIIPDLEETLFIQENALNFLMANQPATIPTLPITKDFEAPAGFFSGVPASLLRNRPDIKSKEYELQAANARIGYHQASLYPSLNITAAGGLNSFQSANWLNIPASVFGNLTGNLIQPLMNRRKLKTALNVSKISYEQKTNEFRNTVLQAIGEVSGSLFKTQKLKEKITIAQSKNKILHKAISDAGLLFTNGMANYLEVITVQQNLLENELSLAQLKKQQATAYVELFRALGGGAD